MASGLAKLMTVLGINTKEFDEGLKGATKTAKGFGDTIKNIFKTLGIAYGVKELLRFTAETVNLAAKAEGIKAAFDKLNNPQLLYNLQKATRNTVADVDLMSAAVRANNFHISLEALPKYFQFAQQRARATGESVDYLVESIVMGIGRKSAMILDNLGISLADINEELKRTPDYATAVGNIMNREMAKAGDVIETTADQTAQLSAAWQNLREELGKKIVSAGIGDAMQLMAEWMRISQDETLTRGQKRAMRRYGKVGGAGIYDSYLSVQQEQLDKISGANGYNPALAASMKMGIGSFNMTAGLGKSSGVDKKEIITITTLAAEIEQLQLHLEGLDITNTAEIKSTLAQIKAKEDLIDKIRSVTDAVEENKRTIMDAQQVWDSMVMPGQAGQQLGGTWGALQGSFADSSQLAEVSEAIGYINTSMSEQTQIASTLGSVFTDMFMDIDQGFKGMADSLIQSIKRIAAEIMAQAAAWAVMKYIFKMDVGNFSSFMGGGGGGVNASAAAAVGSSVGGDLQLTTYIRGTDLAVVVGRGGNSRYNNT